ncbi:NADH-quinone oxidoreductase subunit L [Rhodoblastus acidophilus]|uniref:NADH-quinone oxidoreductase subunit L n=1 Tax=Candidatus Rhodoblastus alkanivorans TaxID=2954117 RepID=A0ABS9Z5H4_9HYPH|nr:NADH-quinone oxidoreductase subunit L [Candidatus Rhodoblastus alkanivorans]MCI4678444.1 NADH-quinone oxidoreductase subunit L [Candidatus Rhodoblastus alkanivorans]MCI4682883.1 NADH-quinone oxidoreductase subunit L [Candidatus Rhodoblastus alkanivorans]MDI4640192.1 NADH-quinone oxidoreductase subunit L [Rhodoblastus acidophilus]
MYSAIVFLPLLGFLIAGLFGRRIGDRPSEIVTTTFLFISLLLSWIVFFRVGFSGAPFSAPVLGNWMTSGDLKIDWALRVDTLTAVMLVVVTTVSALVHLYSIGYMHEDPSRPRFFAYLSLFTFAMLMLVTADNLAQMFFGWEGVGLASYLLIGFWYEKPSANAAAMKAFVVNRVGDFGFALGIFLVFMLTKSISFDVIFAAAPGLAHKTIHIFGSNWDAMTLTCLLLFMGAMGKSAQFLLHTWLPDAMEGPTPVSALIHAATMVTAGVFMVARLSPLFEQSSTALAVVTVIGATTAFFAATIGLVQNDIKRVIAYSTCSQLGYMFVGLGVGGYSLGIFHLFTHAFFKALLFLGAGSVIHAMHHEQDMRKMGGLAKKIPITFWCMTAGTLALTGFPLTAGYFSKDAIIEAAYAAGLHSQAATYGYVLTVVAAGLTSFYSWRLVFMTFFGKPRWAEAVHGDAHGHDDHAHADQGHDDHGHDDHGHHALDPHESPNTMLIPLYVLSFGAIFAGMIFKGAFIGEDMTGFWRGSLFFGPHNHIMHAMEEIPKLAGLLPSLLMVLGFVIAYYFYIVSPETPVRLAERFQPLYQFLLNKWYFDELYDFLFVRPAFWLGRLFWKGGDGAIIDRLGPDGIAARVLDGSGWVARLQTGYIYNYAFAMLIGLAAIITYYLVYGAR